MHELFFSKIPAFPLFSFHFKSPNRCCKIAAIEIAAVSARRILPFKVTIRKLFLRAALISESSQPPSEPMTAVNPLVFSIAEKLSPLLSENKTRVPLADSTNSRKSIGSVIFNSLARPHCFVASTTIFRQRADFFRCFQHSPRRAS